MSSSIITASYDKQVRFWDPASGRTIRNLVFQDSQINALSVSMDRCRLAVAGYGVIRYYDIASSSQYPPAVASFECSAAGNFTSIGHIPLTSGSGALLFACSEDGTLRLLDPRQSSMSVLRECATGIAITCATLSPDYELLYTGSQIGKVSVWHCQSLVHDATHHGAASSKPLQDISFPGDHSAIRSVAVAPIANWVAVATNAGKVHCLSKGAVGCSATSSTNQRQSAPRSSAFPHPPMRGSESCQGSLSEAGGGGATTTNSENASLVSATPVGDTPLNNTQHSASEANSAVPATDAASPTAQLSATPNAPSMPSKPSLILSPLQQQHHLELVHTMICHHKYILKAAVSPDGKLLATCCADYTVGLWGVPQCLARPFEVSSTAAMATPAASPQKVTTSADVSSPQTPTEPGSPSPLAVTAAQSPKLSMASVVQTLEMDARAAGPQQPLVQPKAANPYEFTTLKPLQGHTRWVWDCAFSPCSTALVTVSSDNHVRLWSNILDKPKSDVFVGHTKPVVCVQLDVDRRRAADT